MRVLGPLVRLQIQRSPLKTGEKPDRRYSPAPILCLDRLWVSPDGILGEAPDGAWLVDVHHRAHPATRNPDGGCPVSVGFTGHYGRMRERFGDRVTVGCAGENLIVEATGRVFLDALRGGLAVVAPDGRERLRLDVLDVARPCRPFTGWALGVRVEPEELKRHLQFLDDGMRGFYCHAAAAGEVRVGDQLVALG
jgi:hypothetical protein